MLCFLGLTFSAAASPSLRWPQITFEFRDGFLWVEVRAPEAQDRLRFLLDTGAQMSVLNTATFKKLGAARGRAVTAVGVGSSTDAFLTRVEGLTAGSVPLSRNYMVLNLCELSAACTNGPIDGIIGADFFQKRLVEIDFETRSLGILNRPQTPPQAESLPLKIGRSGMLVKIGVNGSRPEWVRLDTGCATALHWVSPLAQPSLVKKRIVVALSTSEAYVDSAEVTLGSIRFANVPIEIHQNHIFPGEKGLLGNGLLSRFRTVTIDYENKRVLLLSPQEERTPGLKSP